MDKQNHNQTLDGKNIIVIGAAGLLGQSFVRQLLHDGAKVTLADNALAAAEQFAADLGVSSDDTMITHVDITNRQSLEGLIDRSRSQLGEIHGVVNTAYPRNKNYGRVFEDVEYQDFCENTSLNLGGYFLTSQVFAKYFARHGGGHIINIASIYGVIPPKFEIYRDTPMTMPVEYAVIKSGLIHLSKYIAKYYKGKKVQINTVSPGGIFDHQHETFVAQYQDACLNIGMLQPEDISQAISFLFSPAARGVNGQNLVIDDGFTL